MNGRAEFAPKLACELTTIVFCWRIARTDGVTLGFTTHDRALLIGGVRYAAAPGMSPSAIASSDGMDADTMEIEGALTADAITAADLSAGRYDGASVRLFMVDWTDPEGGTLLLARGTLGEVTRRLAGAGGSFAATLNGPLKALEATAIETYSPECRAELGDARCRVALAGLGERGEVAGGGATSFSLAAAPAAGDRLASGRCRVLSGANAGIDRRIAAVTGDTVELADALPVALAPGDRVDLRQGCDKRLATCSGRFGNAANFRGEPHVPGADVLTRFPGV